MNWLSIQASNHCSLHKRRRRGRAEGGLIKETRGAGIGRVVARVITRVGRQRRRGLRAKNQPKVSTDFSRRIS